ncbi:MmcQ/YjbR family DNA-binding protein [Methylobacterium sp. BTF04]|uniref:MmcQ/YjbR family DNA-binding protein n=1 Tax=Methylobacterium sp. BTF04 TaxID=2708300 RepID=UPI0013CF736C|nr:MmcQ/YjbR family DNA-binding protein [Methylobacterium sp. BTF04]NEU11478.1 MmcQ/YjbR family DNA-binding protein [Methylobacterium sp. BTF04]
MKPEDVRALALMLPEVTEGAHSGHPDFRVDGHIFATLWVEEERVVLKLAPADQAGLVEAEPDLFTPLPGAWGRRGWTTLDLWDSDEETLRSALLSAWRRVVPAAYDRL